jgi:hypothetical protein
MSKATLNPPNLEQINRELAKTVSEEMNKVEILTQALRDIIDPIGKIRREMPRSHVLNGEYAVKLADSPEHLRSLAKAALAQIESSD